VYSKLRTLDSVPLLLVALVLLPLMLLALMPLILIQRYRVGTSRRLVRPWFVGLNLLLMAFSALLFLLGAGITSYWVEYAFTGAALGLALGSLLGVLGLVTTRWEPTAATFHYTPNRWLVLIVTFAVTVRVVYGLWRSWTVARAGISGAPVVLAFGIPESLAVGGMVIGYYLVYAIGLRRHLRKWQRRTVRVM
jgi:membrane protein CcdC involved in cytochrome C biogenesis